MKNSIYTFIATVAFCSAMLAAPADFDRTFGTNGKTTTQVGNGNSFILDSALQSDGKLVAVGSAVLSPSQFTIVRYNKNGSLDTTFDGDGIVYTNFGTPAAARAVYILGDGKILVAGSYSGGLSGDFILARYNPDGSLDTTFGTDGKVVTSVDRFGDVANAIAVQFDGRIIVAGSCNNGSDDRFGAVRYNPNGTLDTSFGTDGKIFITSGAASQGVKDVLVLPDGKVLLVGTGSIGSTGADFMLVRLNSNGTMDTSFDNDGILLSDITLADFAFDAILQPDGKFIVVGFTSDGNVSNGKFAAVRYLPNGVRDNEFGLFGTYTVGIGANTRDSASAVAIQPDGKIIIAGTTPAGTDNDDVALVRLTSSGLTDPTFGTAGKVIIPISSQDDSVNDIVLQPNGRIVLAGSSLDANQRFSFTATRLLGRNTGGDYDSDGKTDVGIFRPDTGTWWLTRSEAGPLTIRFGSPGDAPVVGDYDGDGRHDLAVYRPSNRTWYLMQSTNGFGAMQFGLADDIPVPADYDGDGKTDIAVYRPSTGVWYISRSQLGYTAFRFGLNGDIPVVGDFDRDGRADAVLYRPSDHVWYVLGSKIGFYARQFGLDGDVPVSGDFDGDTANDLAVFRPSTGVWYVIRSSDELYQVVQFGTAGDVPTPGDFDGDGVSDKAVFRPSNGTWYVRRSSNNQTTSQPFGVSSDIPVAGFISL